MLVETHKRTVVRMISYRLTAWMFTILWTFLFTGELAKSTGFATVLHILLSVDYYIHERIWLRVRWGLHYGQPTGAGVATITEMPEESDASTRQ